ncbi:hypothetical protein B0J11DRAFT_528992 [Dendryphion nanum]|uniref:Uncharacterized protein n=1 Tax=Dendryphion nanum TaxID=256645 RepID=A0A9P9DUK4_9PLEO|nr:hypothetical protein B0J11DRAFT_528992 [Dendryphion nanum]
MASTRLRRTFNYPTESDDDDAVEAGMDEQDRETLITDLSARDTSSTRLYTHLLLLLPLLPIPFYIPHLFGIATIVPALCAVASLAASAYTLYFLPLPPVRNSAAGGAARKAKVYGQAKAKPSIPSVLQSVFAAPESQPVPFVSSETKELLRRYIIPGNAVVVVVLVLSEVVRRRSWSEGFAVGGGFLPAFVWGMVLGARRELRVVDLGELERLKG